MNRISCTLQKGEVVTWVPVRKGVGTWKHRVFLPVPWVGMAVAERFSLRLCGDNRKKWFISLSYINHLHMFLIYMLKYWNLLFWIARSAKHRFVRNYFSLTLENASEELLCLCHRKVNCYNLQDVVALLAQESSMNSAALKHDKCSDAKEIRRKFRRCSQVE